MQPRSQAETIQKKTPVIIIISLISLLLLFPFLLYIQKAFSSTSINVDDCKKCHNDVVVRVETAGVSHKTQISCTDCHKGHPPRNRQIIPACSNCHKREAHFTLKNCLKCHTDPHAPLEISLTRNITTPCITCHSEQIKQLKEHPSIHTTFACTACHTTHGFVPQCTACHTPHSNFMVQQDCLECHKAHMPLEVTYGNSIVSEFCGSCHHGAYTTLSSTRARHRTVTCISCHAAIHKTIPECQKCHPVPHSKSILDEFPSCGICHGKAHNLKLNRNDVFLEHNE